MGACLPLSSGADLVKLLPDCVTLGQATQVSQVSELLLAVALLGQFGDTSQPKLNSWSSCRGISGAKQTSGGGPPIPPPALGRLAAGMWDSIFSQTVSAIQGPFPLAHSQV